MSLNTEEKDKPFEREESYTRINAMKLARKEGRSEDQTRKIEELRTRLDEVKSKRRKSKASDEEGEDKSCLETSDSDEDDLTPIKKRYNVKSGHQIPEISKFNGELKETLQSTLRLKNCSDFLSVSLK